MSVEVLHSSSAVLLLLEEESSFIIARAAAKQTQMIYIMGLTNNFRCVGKSLIFSKGAHALMLDSLALFACFALSLQSNLCSALLQCPMASQ